MNTPFLLQQARERISIQQRALDLLAHDLDENFAQAVSFLVTAQKVVTTGLGKSGFVARKMAATLSSLRVHATYLHPVDALHGDSGILREGDAVVAFSKSGETSEVLRFLSHTSLYGLHIVGITSRLHSTLATVSHATLVTPVEKELDALNIIPTTSTTSAMVLADVLALATAESVGVTVDDVKRTHPQGAIGHGLLRTVTEVMHSGSDLPLVTSGSSLVDALGELTQKALGAVCIVNAQGELVGVVTDGDVRRFVQAGGSTVGQIVDAMMNATPVCIEQHRTLHEALTLMEQRTRQINVLPVVDQGRCVGLIRLHDIVQTQL